MENAVKKPWDKKGIIAIVLSIPAYFIAAVIFVIYMVKLNAFDSVTAPQLILFILGMDLVPIIQIILAGVSLKQNPEAHKWPAIVAIVLGSIGIILWTVILAGAY